jgi:hypothetical protein
MRRAALVLALMCLEACSSAGAPTRRSVPSRAPLPAEETAPGRPAPPSLPVPRDALSQAGAELRETETALLALLRAKGRVDCVRACALHANMEEIAGRICALATRVPPLAREDAAAACSDAQRRARSARGELASACTCPVPGASVPPPPERAVPPR